METNDRMEDLFGRARTQVPKTTYEQTSRAFQVGIAAAAGGGILTKWAALSLKFKTLIMFTAISSISVTSILIVASISSEGSKNSPEKVKPQTVQGRENQQITTHPDNLEASTQSENIIFNEKIGKNQVETPEKSLRMSKLPNLEQLGLTMLPKQISAFTQKLAPGALPNNNSFMGAAEDSIRMKLFEISEKTTNEEIENIRKQAMDAGLEFTFSTKVRQNKIKKLDLSMKKGNQKWMSKISGTDSFSFTFGWWEDEEGQFEKYICDDDLARICGDCD